MFAWRFGDDGARAGTIGNLHTAIESAKDFDRR